jgi:hypothetical protein
LQFFSDLCDFFGSLQNKAFSIVVEGAVVVENRFFQQRVINQFGNGFNGGILKNLA